MKIQRAKKQNRRKNIMLDTTSQTCSHQFRWVEGLGQPHQHEPKGRMQNPALKVPGATVVAFTLLIALSTTRHAQAYVYPPGCQVSASIFSLTPSTPGPVH